jgi:hypothetical protein
MYASLGCEMYDAFSPILKKPEFGRQFLKNSNIKFHEILSGGRRVVACRIGGL